MLLKIAVVSLLLSISLSANSSFGSIATSPETGTYFKVGKDVATVFKKYKANLQVVPSKGSIENLDTLTGKNGKSNTRWAIVQSDALEYYKLSKKTQGNLENKIKTILPLYTKYIHVFTKKGKKVSFKKGSTLKVGVLSETSNSNITANILEKAYKVNFKYRYVNLKTALKYLKEGKLDIFIDVRPYPENNFKKLDNIDLVMLPKNKLMNKKYLRAKFSKARYPWLKQDIHTYKIPTILVTNNTDKRYDQTVGIFLKIILNNYKALIKYGHPTWRESYRNKSMKLENTHPVAYQILHK